MRLFSKQYKESCWQQCNIEALPQDVDCFSEMKAMDSILQIFKLSSNPTTLVLILHFLFFCLLFFCHYIFWEIKKTCESIRVVGVSCGSVVASINHPLAKRVPNKRPLDTCRMFFGDHLCMRVISGRFWLVLKTWQNSSLRHPAYNSISHITFENMGEKKVRGLVNTRKFDSQFRKQFLRKQR